MKHFAKLLLLVFCLVPALQSCEEEDSYAKERQRERKQIMSFIKKGVQVKDPDGIDYLLNVPGPFNIISEEEFYANDSTTDVEKNEFVLFAGSGVYMQIVRKGTGEKIMDGEKTSVICRYTGFNIATDSIEIENYLTPEERQKPDIMTVENHSGTYTARFVTGWMMSWTGSQQVPNAWTMPLPFINIGRLENADDEIAKVRLVIPSTEGHEKALNNIYPCFYEITYQRGR